RLESCETTWTILAAMGKKDGAGKAPATAFEKANALQLHGYARGLQRQGNTSRAFELYRQVVKKDPNHWLSHVALSRIDSNKGDFPAAAKEMTQAIGAAPDPNKPQLEGLLKRLEAKDDINK